MKIPTYDIAASQPSPRLFSLLPRFIVLAALASPLVLPRPALATNMTLTKALLDSVNGEVDFSKPTIGAGTEAIANVIAPGDTLFVVGHNRARLKIRNLVGQSGSGRITITNTAGTQLVLENTDANPSNALQLGGCQHVALKGTPSAGITYGIKVAGTGTQYVVNDKGETKAVKMVGVRVVDDKRADTNTIVGPVDIEIAFLEIAHATFAGIQAKAENTPSQANYVMDGLFIHDNSIHDTGGEGMYLGWTSDGHHDNANIEVSHNVLTNIGWDAIQVNRCTSHGSVHHNTIIGYGVHSDTAPADVSNPNYYQNDGITGSKNELDIYNNWVESTGNFAGAPVFQKVYRDLYVYNNVLIGRGVSGDPAFESGVYLGTDSANPPVAGAVAKVLNNTIITPESSGVQDATSAEATVFNNLIVEPRNGKPFISGSIAHSDSTNLGVTSSNLADVKFVDFDHGDYRLGSGSSAANHGDDVHLDGVTDDFAGTPRPQEGVFDIGAYERPSSTQTVGILTPLGWGQSGSGYCAATGAFNEQPTWDPVAQEPVGISSTPHADTVTAYVNRRWYIDFGADFAKVRITQLWTRYRPNSPGSYSGFGSLFWSADQNAASGIPAPGLNFETAQNLPNSSLQLWRKDLPAISGTVTPAARYLIVNTGATPSTRPNEFAFVGYRVP